MYNEQKLLDTAIIRPQIIFAISPHFFEKTYVLWKMRKLTQKLP